MCWNAGWRRLSYIHEEPSLSFIPHNSTWSSSKILQFWGYNNFLAFTKEKISFPFHHRFPFDLEQDTWGAVSYSCWSGVAHCHKGHLLLLFSQHIVSEILTFWWAVTFHQIRRNLPRIQSAEENRSDLSRRNELAYWSCNLMTQDEPLCCLIATQIEMFLLSSASPSSSLTAVINLAPLLVSLTPLSQLNSWQKIGSTGKQNKK